MPARCFRSSGQFEVSFARQDDAIIEPAQAKPGADSSTLRKGSDILDRGNDAVSLVGPNNQEQTATT